MKTLNVDLAERSYPIYIGPALLSRDLLLPHVKASEVLVVTNETVAPLYLERVVQQLPGKKVDTVILPDGEAYKSLETLTTIFDRLLAGNHSRSTTLVALGGGVIGDITGFAAACYQRGVNFIQVPTTLLAQVDSSVGGKTAVNHPLGKNMIGAFYQPQCVLADIEVLNTLPERELSAGLAEVIKYGLIYDPAFLRWLEDNIDRLRARDEEALIHAVERSCAIKAAVVAEDEREGGIRAILNLGHTFGHAIEAVKGYGEWLHGEAVGAGMVMALDLSARLGWISWADVERGRVLISRAGLPVSPPNDMTVESFLQAMARDKKVIDGQLRLVLLKALGQACVTAEAPLARVEETIAACLAGRYGG